MKFLSDDLAIKMSVSTSFFEDEGLLMKQPYHYLFSHSLSTSGCSTLQMSVPLTSIGKQKLSHCL